MLLGKFMEETVLSQIHLFFFELLYSALLSLGCRVICFLKKSVQIKMYVHITIGKNLKINAMNDISKPVTDRIE